MTPSFFSRNFLGAFFIRAYLSGENSLSRKMVESETFRSGERSTQTTLGDISGGKQDLSHRHATLVMGSQKINFEKFDWKINFSMWRHEVINALIQIGFDVVLKSKRYLYDQKTWDCTNEKTCSKIRSCLTKEMKYLVKDERAMTLWRTLEKTYLLKSLENCLYTMNQVYGFQIKPDVSMHDHVWRFGKLHTNLKNLDEDFKDEVNAMTLLHLLLEEYNNFMTTLLYSKSVIILIDVYTTLTNLEI